MKKPFLKIGRALSIRSRRQKLDLFMREMSPTPRSRILDIGMAATSHYQGTNILERNWAWKSQLIAVSIDYPEAAKQRYPLIKMIQADGCQLPLSDDSVDLVWSNAVIEHVGDRARQKAFVSEALRIAKEGVFITTPNRWFPLETHIHLPFIHWFPKPLRDAIFRFLGFPRMNSVFLLSERVFRKMFPLGNKVRIVKQGIALIPYSLVAIVRKS